MATLESDPVDLVVVAALAAGLLVLVGFVELGKLEQHHFDLVGFGLGHVVGVHHISLLV